MADLRNTTGETVYLAIRDGREMVCIAVMRGRSAAPPIVRIGGRLPIHATALGKAVLAHATPCRRRRGRRCRDSTAWTPRTIIDPGACCGVSSTTSGGGGLAVEVGEFAAGVSCVASPVFSPVGRGSSRRSRSRGARTSFDADRFAPAIRAAALALTRRLAPGQAGARSDAGSVRAAVACDDPSSSPRSCRR